MRRLLAVAAAAVLLVAFPTCGGAAQLRTSKGAAFSVAAAARLEIPLAGTPNGAPIFAGGGLRYEVTDEDGDVHRGTVPATDTLPGPLSASLAEDPVTHEVFLVFAAPDAAEDRFRVAAWLGQSWSDPEPLSAPAGHPSSPVLAFGPAGDAVLAWSHATDGALPSILVRHFELGTRGEAVAHALLLIQDPAGLMMPIGAPVGLPPGVAHVEVDDLSNSAHVVLADPVRGTVGVLQVMLARDGRGGFNAPPVPVNFSGGFGLDGAPGSTPIGGHPSDTCGAVREPFRVDVLGAEGYYWVDETSVRALAFIDGRAVTPLLVGARPTTDAEAHVRAFLLLRQALSPADPPSREGDRRRLPMGRRSSRR